MCCQLPTLALELLFFGLSRAISTAAILFFRASVQSESAVVTVLDLLGVAAAVAACGAAAGVDGGTLGTVKANLATLLAMDPEPSEVSSDSV